MVGSSRMWSNTWEQSDLAGSVDEDTLIDDEDDNNSNNA